MSPIEVEKPRNSVVLEEDEDGNAIGTGGDDDDTACNGRCFRCDDEDGFRPLLVRLLDVADGGRAS